MTPAARPATQLASGLFHEVELNHTEKGGFAGDCSGFFVREKLLIPLVGREANGHLGDDTAQNSSEALVQTQCRLLPHDINTSTNETARFYLGLLAKDPD